MEESRDVDACVSFNGQSNIKLKASDNVIIRHKHHQLQLMQSKDYDYYPSSEKTRLERRTRQELKLPNQI